jgi:glycerol uptake operon antiterminator
MQEYTGRGVPFASFFAFISQWRGIMNKQELLDRLEQSPVIAAVQDGSFEAALASPAEVIFCLKSNLLTVAEQVKAAHAAGKCLFVHLDLADGIGKDKVGIAYLASIGVDGLISTRTQLVKHATECGLVGVQRFFALDSKGVESIAETLAGAAPDLIEIMPGIAGKVIERFAAGRIPVIAGGLIETKKEVTAALDHGALAVSTGRAELWYL